MASTLLEVNERSLLTMWALESQRQRDGTEVTRVGARQPLIEILAAGLGSLARRRQRDPARCLQLRGLGFQEGVFAGPGIAYHFPAITGHLGLVNQDGSYGAAAQGFFILVGPAAVVGEGLAAKKVGIVGRRLTY